MIQAGGVFSPTLQAQAITEELRASGHRVYNWGLGQSPFPPPPQLVGALKRHCEKASYAPINGVKGFDLALGAEPGRVIVASCKQLLFTLQACFSGEIVMIAPYWVSYMEQAQLLGRQTATIEAPYDQGCRLLPHQIDEHCAKNPEVPRLLIFNNPTNPTGVAYSASELMALAAAIRKYNIIVVSDEVYALNHYENGHRSLAEFLPERTITLSGLSKGYSAGGYRVGWAIFPEELIQYQTACERFGSSTFSCAPAPQQHAAKDLLSNPNEYQAYLHSTQAILKQAAKEVVSRLRAIGIDCLMPEAAWYLWMKFERLRDRLASKGIFTSEQLQQRLKDELGWVLISGVPFGINTEQLYCRGSFIDFDGQKVLKKPQNFHQEMQRVFESITLLEYWLYN